MSRFPALPRNRLLIGDALRTLERLPSASVDMVLTSPPYYRQRNYQVAGQYGDEPNVDAWVARLEPVLAEIGRLLTPTGTLWLNLGDGYSRRRRDGAEAKSLLLGPERLALSLVRGGWRLRNKVIWNKSNPLPTSVRDRLACSYEVVYLLTRQASYFFDLDAIRQPHRSRPPRPTTAPPPAGGMVPPGWRGANTSADRGLHAMHAAGRAGHPRGKNPGDVWTLPTASYHGNHYATMSLPLAERAILAGCPDRRCSRCRRPWRRASNGAASRGRLTPSCTCQAASEPGLVLDPFFGSGTTALAAELHGRDWLGVELSPAFAGLAERRLSAARRVRPTAVEAA